MENELRAIIEEYFQNSDYKIIDFIERGERGTKVVEIFLDNKQGVNIDEMAKINRDLNSLVDEKIFLNDISKLVVSSPGIERPFKYLWQLYKHTGRTLELKLNSGEHIEGKLLNISDDGNEILFIEILPTNKKMQNNSELKEINFKDITESKVKISFSK